MKKKTDLLDPEEREEQERTRIHKQLFLEALESRPSIKAACIEVAMNRSTYYAWRKSDPEFAKRADEANGLLAKVLLETATIQALSGDRYLMKDLLHHLHPDFKRNRSKEEKHIFIHHITDRSGKEAPKTLEDFLDHLDAMEEEEAIREELPQAAKLEEKEYGSLIAEALKAEQTQPLLGKRAAASKPKEKPTPRERRREARKNRGNVSVLLDFDGYEES